MARHSETSGTKPPSPEVCGGTTSRKYGNVQHALASALAANVTGKLSSPISRPLFTPTNSATPKVGWCSTTPSPGERSRQNGFARSTCSPRPSRIRVRYRRDPVSHARPYGLVRCDIAYLGSPVERSPELRKSVPVAAPTQFPVHSTSTIRKVSIAPRHARIGLMPFKAPCGTEGRPVRAQRPVLAVQGARRPNCRIYSALSINPPYQDPQPAHRGGRPAQYFGIAENRQAVEAGFR